MINLDELNSTRSATKKQSFQDLLLGWTDRDRQNLIGLGAKNGCMIAIHPAGVSSLTPAESVIHVFRRCWQDCGYDNIRLNFFEFQTSTKAVDYILNSRPLLLYQNRI